MNDIIPGILEKEWSEIEKKLQLIKPFAKTVHIDIIDGKFANNTTFLNPAPFKKYSQDFFFELHMMTDNPLSYLKTWAEAGFKRFLGHIEKMSSQKEFVREAKLYGEAGLAIDGPTSIDKITVSLDDLNVILIYTSDRVGFSGPPLNTQRLEKIKALRAQNPTLPIEVDGGINDQTLPRVKEAGANRFISTSYLFNSPNLEQTFKNLTQL